MRGRIALGGRGHFDSHARDIAEDTRDNLTEVDCALGNAEVEVDREAYRDNRIGKRIDRNLLNRILFCFGKGFVQLSGILLVIAVVKLYGMTNLVAYVIGKLIYAASEVNVETSEL